eukprot:304522_1
MGKCMSSSLEQTEKESNVQPKEPNVETDIAKQNINVPIKAVTVDELSQSTPQSTSSLSSSYKQNNTLIQTDNSEYFNISFKCTYSELLSKCEQYHRRNLDKLRLGELCVACNCYYEQIDLYLKSIENNKNLIDLQPLKYILLSFIIHPKIEYYTQIKNAYPKYQIMMEDWNTYAIKHSKLKKSINILKKQIKSLNMDDFINLIYKLQPWMTGEQLWEIIQFEKKTTTLCNGCGAAKLRDNRTICWVCHIGFKVIFLLYFAVDLWIDEAFYFDKITSYLMDHHVAACDWFWTLDKSYRYIQLFGNHILPGHIVNKIRDKRKNEMNDKQYVEYCKNPPIVSIETFKTIQRNYMIELKQGYKTSSQNPTVLSVSVANELGNINIYRL